MNHGLKMEFTQNIDTLVYQVLPPPGTVYPRKLLSLRAEAKSASTGRPQVATMTRPWPLQMATTTSGSAPQVRGLNDAGTRGQRSKDPSALAYGPTQHFVERITDVRGTALQQEQARSLLTKPMALALEERASRRCCGA